MTTSRTCPQCGAPLPPGAADWLCPKCLLGQAVVSASPANPTTSLTPAKVIHYFGDYELFEEISRGGMGVVYKARQTSLNRIVAVKVLLFGPLAGKDFVRRFRAEATAAANLQHPGIVAIHEVGAHGGQHYFTMDFVPGGNLSELARDQPVQSRPAAQLLQAAAEAVHFAHQRGVLHRDLKPSNILLDADGRPKVTDFGVAKIMDRVADACGGDRRADPQFASQTPFADHTHTGQVLGTPAFMAPEQALGRPGLTEAVDVYGLGAVLYFLTTGRAPFGSDSLQATLRQVQESDPVSPRLLNSAIARDLETICLKCLSKDPSRRYSTAQLLAEDLGRFLNDSPIQARPSSLLEKTWRWCRKSPTAASLAALTLVLIVTLIVGTTVAAVRIDRERNRAVREQTSTLENLYAADMYLVQHSLNEGNLGLARQTLEAYLPRGDSRDLRGWEWRYFWQLSQGDSLETWRGHSNNVSALAISPSGKIAASAGWDETVRIWNLPDGRLLETFCHPGAAFNSISFSHDGNLLAAGNNRGGAMIWDVAQGRTWATLVGSWSRIAFSPVDTLLAVCMAEDEQQQLGQVILWDCATKQTVKTLASAGRRAAFSPDGKTLVTAGDQTPFQLWDVATGRERLAFTNGGSVLSLRFSPDGKTLASSDWDGHLQLWDAGTGRKVAELTGHSARIWDTVFSPDGHNLAAASSDHSVELWDAQSLRHKGRLIGHSHEVWSVAFLPDNRLISGGKDHRIMLWNQSSNAATKVTRAHPTNSYLGYYVFSESAALAAVGKAADNCVHVRDWSSEQIKAFLTNVHYPLAFSERDRLLTTLTTNYLVSEWDWAANQLQRQIALTPLDDPPYKWCFDGLTHHLATATRAGQIAVWKTTDGSRRGAIEAHRGRINKIAFSPNGKFLASAGSDRLAKIFDAHTLAECAVLRSHQDAITDVDFSPDGSVLLTASDDGTARLWQVAAWHEIATLRGHKEGVGNAAFSPDGRTIATCGEGELKLWHVATRRELATLKCERELFFMRFAPDGRTLFEETWRGSTIIWTAPSLTEVDAFYATARSTPESGAHGRTSDR